MVLPVDLPGEPLRAIDELGRVLPAARVVVVTAVQHDDELLAAVFAGASGYLGKDVSGARLPHILRSVLAGEAALPQRLSGRLLDEVRARHHRRHALYGDASTPLTVREWDMVEELRVGRRTPEIARRLDISEVTVRRHISSLVAKLGVRDRQTAVALIRKRTHDRRSRF